MILYAFGQLSTLRGSEGGGKVLQTSASAFIAASAAISLARHARSRVRGVRSSPFKADSLRAETISAP